MLVLLKRPPRPPSDTQTAALDNPDAQRSRCEQGKRGGRVRGVERFPPSDRRPAARNVLTLDHEHGWSL